MPSRPLIELRDVDITADTHPVVRALSLDIARGRVLAIVSERAEVRQALASVLTGDIDNYALAGDLVLDGRELVGRVASQGMSPAQQHVAALHAPAEGRTRLQDLAPAALLQLVGLEASDARVGTLPEPERIRAAYALALATDPLLLVIDLPYGGEAGSSYPLHSELIRRLARDGSRTIVVCTDSLAIAADVADDVVVTLDGVPVESGSVYDVCLRPAMPYVQDLLRVTPSPHRVLPEHTAFVDLARRDGCPWVFNCRAAVVRACSQQRPGLHAVALGHAAACHLLEVRDGD